MKTFLLLFALAATILPALAASSLTPEKPIPLTGTHGKFDFIKVDAKNRRLLACHTGNGSLDVIDIDKSQLVKSIPTGNAQGVAIDEKGGRYFVSCSKPPKLVIIDSAKLEVTGEVPLPAPADLCAYSTTLSQVFVDNDESARMWVIDPETKTVVHTSQFPNSSGMEDLAFNADGTVFIQNIKEPGQLVCYVQPSFIGNTETSALSISSATLPADKPHGLAMLNDDTVLIAGGNGKLVLLNYKAGKILASCDIAPKVDEIAYDPNLGRAYCASGTGQISVVFVSANKLTPLDTVPSAPGCHSIAVDPKKHTVWIAYTKGDQPVVQAFTEQ